MDSTLTKVTVNYKVPERIKNLTLAPRDFGVMDTSERCGIFIYSHKLTPKTLILNSEDFILDGIKYGKMMMLRNIGTVIIDENDQPHQHESDWWQNELPPFKAACKMIDEFGWRCGKVNIGNSFEWNFANLTPSSEFIELFNLRNGSFLFNTVTLKDSL